MAAIPETRSIVIRVVMLRKYLRYTAEVGLVVSRHQADSIFVLC